MVICALILLCVQNVHAIPYVSPQDLFQQSEMVFYGQVIKKQAGPGPDYNYYQVQVKTYFKNPQTSDSITIAGHKPDNETHLSYPQFEVGDKAIFYINKLDGVNTISPYSQTANYVASVSDDKSAISMNFKSISDSTKLPSLILSPLKQFKSGVTREDIFCKEGFYLAIKSHDQEPACLKSGTISKLASRGFLYGIGANESETHYSTILIPPGSENPSTNKTYSPEVTSIVLGVNNTVRWVNQASAANSVVSDSPITQNGKSFGSGILIQGASYQFTFTEPGSYQFHGEPHPWQNGTIVVLSTISKPTNQDNGTLVILGEGQREGPLLVQKILPDGIEGLNFREFPLATNVGYPINLHIGDSASNGCTVVLTLVKISGSTATFLKKEYQNRPCPICLSENTLIDTSNGPVNVKELREGMTVFTQDSSGHKDNATILKTGRTLVPPGHRMVHVVLDDKRELYVSPNHPTADGRLFGELLGGNTLDGSKIKSIEQVSYNGTYTYDILPSGKTGFYWANEILVDSTLK